MQGGGGMGGRLPQQNGSFRHRPPKRQPLRNEVWVRVGGWVAVQARRCPAHQARRRRTALRGERGPGRPQQAPHGRRLSAHGCSPVLALSSHSRDRGRQEPRRRRWGAAANRARASLPVPLRCGRCRERPPSRMSSRCRMCRRSCARMQARCLSTLPYSCQLPTAAALQSSYPPYCCGMQASKQAAGQRRGHAGRRQRVWPRRHGAAPGDAPRPRAATSVAIMMGCLPALNSASTCGTTWGWGGPKQVS